jgi:hypothetical protein
MVESIAREHLQKRVFDLDPARIDGALTRERRPCRHAFGEGSRWPWAPRCAFGRVQVCALEFLPARHRGAFAVAEHFGHRRRLSPLLRPRDLRHRRRERLAGLGRVDAGKGRLALVHGHGAPLDDLVRVGTDDLDGVRRENHPLEALDLALLFLVPERGVEVADALLGEFDLRVDVRRLLALEGAERIARLASVEQLLDALEYLGLRQLHLEIALHDLRGDSVALLRLRLAALRLVHLLAHGMSFRFRLPPQRGSLADRRSPPR